MKCPLFMQGNLAAKDSILDSTNNCILEECAWWDEDNDRCDLRTLVKYLGFISVHLIEIRDKKGG